MKNIIGKVVVLGHQGVGKTSTITRFVENTYTQNIAPTIGAVFFVCKINIEDTTVTLQIWDTAGQERFKAMAPMFYRNANAALLVFDITSRTSFESMQGWVQELRRNVEETMVLVVVGNKTDLTQQREVSREEALQYSKSIGGTYLESSALEDLGIGIIFENIAHGLLRLYGQEASKNLRVYNDDLMATSSELEPTDVGNEETVNVSIDSVAHGNPVKSKCC